MENGFLLIDKEKGLTSYDVIRKIKKKLPRKTKVGHSGTLDPDTEGLLVIAIGKATKFLSELTSNSEKEYVARMRFGIKTDSGDISGNVVEKNSELDIDLTPELMENLVHKFVGSYFQKPPALSAKKVNGKRSYDYFYNGVEIELTPVEVHVSELEILEINPEDNEVLFRAVTSKGTYIRSLIEDMASEVGEVATMIELTRTKTDGFSLSDAVRLSGIEAVEEYIFPLETYMRNTYSYQMKVDGKIEKLIKNGVKIKNPAIVESFDRFISAQTTDDLKILFTDENDKIIALYKKNKDVYEQIINVWSE